MDNKLAGIFVLIGIGGLALYTCAKTFVELRLAKSEPKCLSIRTQLLQRQENLEHKGIVSNAWKNYRSGQVQSPDETCPSGGLYLYTSYGTIECTLHKNP
jgi:hypothetical protein